MTKRIDAHQHFWRRSRGDYAWLRDDVAGLAPLLRDFSPDDLKPLLAANGVERTVLVQAAESTAETDFMLELAGAHDAIGGVVGWVRLSDAGCVDTLRRWARHPKFKGVRPMLQELSDPDWIAHAPHPDAVRAVLDLGLRFDALVKPWHLQALLRFIERWPQLPVVIDHGAKPQLAAGWGGAWVHDWERGMAQLAERPHVHCKVSGLLTEAHPADVCSPTTASDRLQPVWDRLLGWFGPSRLMWGSDWPVLNLAGDYGGWVRLADGLMAGLTPAEREQVWHDTARRFYGLDG